MNQARQALRDEALRPLLTTSGLSALLLATAWLSGRDRVMRLDGRLTAAIRAHPVPYADIAITVTQWLFSAQVLLLAVALAVIALWLSGRRSVAASLARFFPAVVVGFILKVALRLPAPETVVVNGQLARGGCTALECGFPSGHVLRAAFLLLWLALVVAPLRGRPLASAAAVVVTVAVAWTRVYSGDHFVLDVVGGALTALTFLPAAVAATRQANEGARWGLSVGPGGLLFPVRKAG
ncbi:MAG TPA: phosphatase PAP2 family protein [Chloroflexota bacterium]